MVVVMAVLVLLDDALNVVAVVVVVAVVLVVVVVINVARLVVLVVMAMVVVMVVELRLGSLSEDRCRGSVGLRGDYIVLIAKVVFMATVSSS